MSERQEIKKKLLETSKKIGPLTRDSLPALQVWALLEIADALEIICVQMPETSELEAKIDRLTKIVASK